MKRINIGVIGCGGRISALLDQMLSRHNRKGDLVIKALYDPDPQHMAAFCRKFNTEAVCCKRYQDLVKQDDIDWVVIGSWNCFHKEQAVAALRAGKNVFCEKPLATTLADGLAMKKAVIETKNKFLIGFTLRYSPHYLKIKEIVESGAIGKIVSMEFNETLEFNHGGYIMSDWRRYKANAGTHLLEKCCHDIDLANWIVGSRASRVASFGGLDFFTGKNAGRMRQLARSKENYRAYCSWEGARDKDPFCAGKDILDNQVALIEYKNRVRAMFHTNCNAGIPERRMYILGTHGAIRSDVLTGTIQLKKIGFDEPLKDIHSGASDGHGDGDTHLTRHMAAVMRGEEKPCTTIDDGLRSAITCFAIDKAQESGRVIDCRPLWQKAGITR
jgi:predicted dehydrogenase